MKRRSSTFKTDGGLTKAGVSGLTSKKKANSRANSSSSSSLLLSFEHVKKHHDYMADNEWIHTGYRAPTGFWGTLFSLFSFHNETINVWSHLIGALYFLASFFLIVYEILFGGLSSSIITNSTDTTATSPTTLYQIFTYGPGCV